MKERKKPYVRNLTIRNEADEIVPLTGRYAEVISARCKLIVAELETGQRYEFADEGA